MEGKESSVYVTILTDTLSKKLNILNSLKTCTSYHTSLLDRDPVDMEAFENAMDERNLVLKELEEVDVGFESIYQRVEKELKLNKQAYKQSIQKMKELIQQIAACSADIQVLEERNKKKFENYLTIQRNSIKISVQSNKMANAYYNNMADQHHTGQSYFLDKKK